MKKELIQIRKILSESFGKYKFGYYDHKETRDYINKQAFPFRSDENIKEHKEFKLLFKTNPYKANLQRLMFIDLLILNQEK